MKKLLSLLLSAVLLLSCTTVYADTPEQLETAASPSKTIKDINKTVACGENEPPNSGFFVIVEDDEENYQELIERCNVQIEKLAGMTIPEYFAPGHEARFVADLATMGITEPLRVYEFWPVIAGNYLEEYGRVTIIYYAATKYPAGETVCIMLGFYNNDENNTVEWHMFEGVGQKDGSVKFVTTPEIVLRIQNETGLMAIISNDLSGNRSILKQKGWEFFHGIL